MSFLENFTEEKLEEAAIEVLQELEYEYIFAPDISSDGPRPERRDYREVILAQRVKDALFKNNRDLPQEALDEAFRQIIAFNSPMLEENNRYLHQLLVEGIEVSFREEGINRTKKAFLIDFNHPERNDFLVVNQFTIVEHEERRPDLLLFINGLPLVVIELKSATDENVGIDNAYEQIQTYKRDIPSLFNEISR